MLGKKFNVIVEMAKKEKRESSPKMRNSHPHTPNIRGIGELVNNIHQERKAILNRMRLAKSSLQNVQQKLDELTEKFRLVSAGRMSALKRINALIDDYRSAKRELVKIGASDLYFGKLKKAFREGFEPLWKVYKGHHKSFVNLKERLNSLEIERDILGREIFSLKKDLARLETRKKSLGFSRLKELARISRKK